MNQTTNAPGLVEGQKTLQFVMRFVWVSVAIGMISAVVGVVLIGFQMIKIANGDPEFSLAPLVIPMVLGTLAVMAGVLLSIVIAFYLGKGHNWARWVYLFVCIWSTYSATVELTSIQSLTLLSVIQVILFLGGSVLQIYICWMLFKSPARLVFLKDKLARLENDLKALRGEGEGSPANS